MTEFTCTACNREFNSYKSLQNHNSRTHKIKGIQNSKMVAEKDGHKMKYSYKLEPGISEVKGGINVLTEMNYPKEIIDNTILQSKQM